MSTVRALRSACRAVSVFVAAAAAALPTRAFAGDSERATDLFNEARSLAQSGQREAACARFHQSFDLDPRTGTILNIAICEEAEGHFLRAHQRWLDAIALARRNGDPRAGYAETRARAIAERTPKIVLRTARGASKNFTVAVDDAVLPPAEMMSSDVDPGEHRVVVTDARREERVWRVTLTERDVREIALDPPDDSPGIANPELAPPARLTIAPPLAAKSSGWMRPTGYGVAVASAGALAVGTYFVVDALSKKGAADSNGCSADICSSETGLRLRSDSANAAGWATAAFIGAGLAAVGSAVLIALDSRGGRAAVTGRYRSLQLALTPVDISAVAHF